MRPTRLSAHFGARRRKRLHVACLQPATLIARPVRDQHLMLAGGLPQAPAQALDGHFDPRVLAAKEHRIDDYLHGDDP